MDYTQDQAAQAAARAAQAQAIAEHARQCACGAAGAIVLHKLSTHEFTPRRDLQLPACGPCAVVLMEQGWSPEKEGK